MYKIFFNTRVRIIPVIKSGVQFRQNLYGDTSTQRPEVYILRCKLPPLSRAGKEIGKIYMVTFLHKVQKNNVLSYKLAPF